ncbi:ATP-dependent helicase [Lottiidibacillus patelloidae]|uniref:ATP-dependent helicase n=1 Tax=Lottiidibacillus patelloidae TaxID=2670334 RepID=A0A263BUW4_9BACI|nr:ATP-dependent DNA helicase [Lottiidibacillus patelloidae]OZM57332.1 ATP-dependent helicase [Lottiidibacillus patelloidae]
MLQRKKLPFEYNKDRSFFESLGDWIGDVFYDIMPEHGFELRDEQIFMAFQLERAFQEKKVMLSEAGVGTGKTIVYLLYAICYARYTGKPAIIACADESLIEQLVKPDGDIAKIDKMLHLNIDARLAKSDEQYLCIKKLEQKINMPEHKGSTFGDIYKELPEFAKKQGTMQTFEPYGDRKQYPDLKDEKWQHINWDVFQNCTLCDVRHRCGKTLTREHVRNSSDIIICSHDYYMQHVWTSDARKREGQLPLLPEYSSVVFDEGHLLEVSAQKALSYKMKDYVLIELFERLLQNDIREKFALLMEEFVETIDVFFEVLETSSKRIEGSNRMTVNLDEQLQGVALKLKQLVSTIGDELVFESETFVLDEYETKVIDEHLDEMMYALTLLLGENDAIIWSEEDEDGFTLITMPKTVKEVLRDKVFQNKKPYIFSSATLSENESFNYVTNSLGIDDYLSFSVASPFNYEENMTVNAPFIKSSNAKIEALNESIKQSEGRALVLCNSKKELQELRDGLKSNLPWELFVEGEKEITALIEKFQKDEHSILCAKSLWEGLDIPGNALKNVIIYSLPFPPNDPVFEAKRAESGDPYWEIDVPYMLLRLRQGIGRLIRTSNDSGSIVILDEKLLDDKKLLEKVKGILPNGVALEN